MEVCLSQVCVQQRSRSKPRSCRQSTTVVARLAGREKKEIKSWVPLACLGTRAPNHSRAVLCKLEVMEGGQRLMNEHTF